MQLPTIDDAIAKMAEIAETEVRIDPDAPLLELEVDSLDLLEWLYEIEEQVGVQIDESIFRELAPTVTLRDVHATLIKFIETSLGLVDAS